MTGKGSVNHNDRKFTAQNVDKERTKNNVVYCNENIRTIYHKLFDDAVKRLVPGAGTRRFAATRDIEGTYAFVYAPVGRAFTVDFRNLPECRYQSAWMNPRTGEYSSWETFERTNTRRFTPPCVGELLDWVLVIRKAN